MSMHSVVASAGRTPNKPKPRTKASYWAIDLTPTWNLAFTAITGYTDNDGNEYKLLEPPLTSVLCEFPEFTQTNVHNSRVVYAQTRDSDWRLTLEVVTTANGQHINASVSLVPPEGEAFGAGHVRRSNPILEILHKTTTDTSASSVVSAPGVAWRREDVKVSFGWRTFDHKSGWKHTIENVLPMKVATEQYLVRDTLIVRFKFNEYERGSVESWKDANDPDYPNKQKERLNGYAACTFKNGNQYVGSWICGRQSGSGEFINNKPYSRYVGQFADGIRHGKGDFTFSDGTRYEGGWNAGMQHGNGRWHFAHDSGSVDGEWFEGKLLRGRGQFLNFDSGAQYTGDFGPGLMRHGQGTLTAIDGTRISGEWKNNNLTNGHGVRVFDSPPHMAGATYTGEMGLLERGKQLILYPNGAGRVVFPPLTPGSAPGSGGTLTGTWKQNVFVNGHGTRHYPNTTIASPSPVTSSGVRDPTAAAAAAAGYGTMTYTGEFAGAEFQRHGLGSMQLADYHLNGEWKNNEFVIGRGSKEYKEGLYYGGLRGVPSAAMTGYHHTSAIPATQREGMGMFLFRYSAQVFIGYWKEDTMFHSGLAKYNTGGSFWGYWLAGRVHGCGVFEWPHRFKTVTLREYTDGKLVSETTAAPSAVLDLHRFKHEIICSPLSGMSNPIASLFTRSLSSIAGRARLESAEYDQLFNRVAGVIRTGSGRQLPVERIIRSGAFGHNTLISPSGHISGARNGSSSSGGVELSIVVVVHDFAVANVDTYMTVINERLEHEYPHRVFRRTNTAGASAAAAANVQELSVLIGDVTIHVSAGGILADDAPRQFLALTPPHRDYWRSSAASLVSALIRPLTSAAPNSVLPLYTHLIRVVKVWADAMPFAACSAPSELLLELMCLQVCGGERNARPVPIDAPNKPTAAQRSTSSGSLAASYHVPDGCTDLVVAFRAFLTLCVHLDTQRVYWDTYYGRKQIPTYYIDRTNEKTRAQTRTAAMDQYTAASTIVVTSTPATATTATNAAAPAGGAAKNNSAAPAPGAALVDTKSDAAGGDGKSATAPVFGDVVYLHPVIPTLNVADGLTDCAPLKHYAMFSLSLLEVYTDADAIKEYGIGIFDEVADCARQRAAATQATAIAAEAEATAAAAAKAAALAARSETSAAIAASRAAAAASLVDTDTTDVKLAGSPDLKTNAPAATAAAGAAVAATPAAAAAAPATAAATAPELVSRKELESKQKLASSAPPTTDVLIAAPTTRDDPFSDPEPLRSGVTKSTATAAATVPAAAPAATPAATNTAPVAVVPAPATVPAAAATAQTATSMKAAQAFVPTTPVVPSATILDMTPTKPAPQPQSMPAVVAKPANAQPSQPPVVAAPPVVAPKPAVVAAPQPQPQAIAKPTPAPTPAPAAVVAPVVAPVAAPSNPFDEDPTVLKPLSPNASTVPLVASAAAAAAAAAPTPKAAIAVAPTPTAAAATPASGKPAATATATAASTTSASASNPFGAPAVSAVSPVSAPLPATTAPTPPVATGPKSTSFFGMSIAPSSSAPERKGESLDSFLKSKPVLPTPTAVAPAVTPAAAKPDSAAVTGPRCTVCSKSAPASDRANVTECFHCSNPIHKSCAIQLDAVNREIRFCTQKCRTEYMAEQSGSASTPSTPPTASATAPAHVPPPATAAVPVAAPATVTATAPVLPPVTLPALEPAAGVRKPPFAGAQPTPFAQLNGTHKPTPAPTPAAIVTPAPTPAPTPVPAAAAAVAATPSAPAPIIVYAGPKLLPLPPPAKPAACRVCERALRDSDKLKTNNKKNAAAYPACCNCAASIHVACSVPDEELGDDSGEFIFCSNRCKKEFDT